MTAASVLRMSVTSRGINMDSLQTGSAGLVSGDLFRSSGAPGFLEIV